MLVGKGLFVALGFSFSKVFAGAMTLISAYYDFGRVYAAAEARLLTLINERPATHTQTRLGMGSKKDNPANMSDMSLWFKSHIRNGGLFNRDYLAGKNGLSLDAILADETVPHIQSVPHLTNTSSRAETGPQYLNLTDYFALAQRFNSMVYKNNYNLSLDLNSQSQFHPTLNSEGFYRNLLSPSVSSKSAIPKAIIYHIVSKNEKNQIISLMAGISYLF